MTYLSCHECLNLLYVGYPVVVFVLSQVVGCTSVVMGSGWVLCGYDCGCIAYDG